MWRLTLSKAARVKPFKGLTPALQVAGEVQLYTERAMVGNVHDNIDMGA